MPQERHARKQNRTDIEIEGSVKTEDMFLYLAAEHLNAIYYIDCNGWDQLVFEV